MYTEIMGDEKRDIGEYTALRLLGTLVHHSAPAVGS